MLKKLTLKQTYPYLTIITATVGLIASFILSYDTLNIAHNPGYVPVCNLNPVLSCGSVIQAAGDKIFGLPFPFYGIAAFAVVITVSVSLLAGAKMNKWFWRAYLAAITLGLIGAALLLIKSVYKIHALCPFCLSVDLITSITFWYTLLYCFDTGQITLTADWFKKSYPWVRKHHFDLILLFILIVAGLLLKHFWYYYGKHL